MINFLDKLAKDYYKKLNFDEDEFPLLEKLKARAAFIAGFTKAMEIVVIEYSKSSAVSFLKRLKKYKK